MEIYDESFLDLPRPETEEQKKELINKNQPFIVEDTIETRVDGGCLIGSETRVLKVYVPSEKYEVEITYPHYNTLVPLASCENALRDKLKKEGLSKEGMDPLVNFLYRESKLVEQDTLLEQLDDVAILKKIVDAHKERAQKLRQLESSILK